MFTTDIYLKKSIKLYFNKGLKNLNQVGHFPKILTFFLLKVGPFENLKSYGY